jgi:hypothetical protein
MPTTENSNPVVAVVFLNTTVELLGMDQTHQLRENVFAFVHRCSRLSDENYSQKSNSNRSQPKNFTKN